MLDLNAYPCHACGAPGLHACTGRPLPPPTPEEEARMGAALRKAFGPFARDERECAALGCDQECGGCR